VGQSTGGGGKGEKVLAQDARLKNSGQEVEGDKRGAIAPTSGQWGRNIRVLVATEASRRNDVDELSPSLVKGIKKRGQGVNLFRCASGGD